MPETLPIREVKVGNRYRKDMGDLNELVASIKKLGLLQPIVVRPDNTLVAGERRLAACKSLGHESIPVHVAHNLEEEVLYLTAERDENTCRKEFTLEEKLALGRAIEAVEKPKAQERIREGHKRKGEPDPQRDRDVGRVLPAVAKVVGMGKNQYHKARYVEEKGSPEVKEEMYRTGKVGPAYQKVREGKQGTRPVGLSLAYKACELLRQIPEDDPLREEGFREVVSWIEQNR